MTIKISNETIKKLTSQELNDLGVFGNAGVILVKGTPKARVKTSNGWWKGTPNDTMSEIVYTADDTPIRYEMIKHAGEGYAFRTFNTATNEYQEAFSPLTAMPFIK